VGCYDTSRLQDEYCTSQTRIADYFAILARNGLWPSLEPFGERIVFELADRFARAMDDRKHQCHAGADCPLRRALEGLSHNVNRIVEDVEGVSPDFGSDGWGYSELMARWEEKGRALGFLAYWASVAKCDVLFAGADLDRVLGR